jgi:hypothetical protein
LLNSYNKIAPIYSIISRLAFGLAIEKIQKQLIQHLPTTGNLLILGGGNGNILPLIYLRAPEINIEYLEASSSMIKSAKLKAPKNQKIIFTHTDQFEIAKSNADLIYSSFFWDLFSEKDIRDNLQIIEKQLSLKPTWFVADFIINKNTKFQFFRKFQMKVTILFFRIFTDYKLKTLPDIFTSFDERKYNTLKNSTIRGNFIAYKVLEKL